MNVLAVAQSRRVRPATWLLVALLVLTAPVIGASLEIGERAVFHNEFLFHVFAALAASLLFAADATSREGAYLRSLPLARSALFCAKLFAAARGLAVSVLAWALLVATGATHALAALVGSGFGFEPRYVPPSAVELEVFASSCALVFATSAFLTAGFARPSWSQQAWVPGLGLGLALFAAVHHLLPDASLARLFVSFAVSAFLLEATRRLVPLRGVAARDKDERIARAVPRRDVPVVALGWTLAVAVPLVALVDPMLASADVAPLPGERVERNVAIWLAVGALTLPFALRTLRAAGASPARTAAGAALALTGVGWLVWRAVLRPDVVVRCAECGRAVHASLAACPACGATRRAWPRHRTRRLRWPQPAVLALLVVMVPLCLQLALGALRHLHGFELRTVPAGATLLRDGEPLRPDELRGWHFGPALGEKNGAFSGMSSSSSTYSTAYAAVTGEQLLEQLVDEGERDTSLVLAEVIDPRDAFTFRFHDLDARAKRIALVQRYDAGRVYVELTFELAIPALDELAAELRAQQARGTLGADLLDRALGYGPALVDALLNQVGDPLALSIGEDGEIEYQIEMAAPLAQRERIARTSAMLDTLARRASELDGGARPTPEALERALAERLARAAAPVHDLAEDSLDDPAFVLAHGQLELRALALLGEDARAWIARGIAANDTAACLVAGLTRERGWLEPLEACLRRNEELAGSRRKHDAEPPDAKLAAAWALVRVDGARAADALLDSLERVPDRSLVPALGLVDGPRVESWLAHVLSLHSEERRVLFDLPDESFGEVTERELHRALAAVRMGMGPEHLRPTTMWP